MTGSHRLIACTPVELFDILQACCAQESAAAARAGIRGHLPVRANRRLLMRARGRLDPPHRAQMVSTTRFGQAQWEVTCDQGAHGSIAHLRLDPSAGLARWLPHHLRFIYLTIVGDAMLRTIDDYAAQRAS